MPGDAFIPVFKKSFFRARHLLCKRLEDPQNVVVSFDYDPLLNHGWFRRAGSKEGKEAAAGSSAINWSSQHSQVSRDAGQQ